VWPQGNLCVNHLGDHLGQQLCCLGWWGVWRNGFLSFGHFGGPLSGGSGEGDHAFMFSVSSQMVVVRREKQRNYFE
jgi:hypothetical protein